MARRTRRFDGKPETVADKKFHALRDGGYRGGIDQDGDPAEFEGRGISGRIVKRSWPKGIRKPTRGDR